MSEAGPDTVGSVTGALSAVILLLALVTPVLARLILGRYRRAVLRAMAGSSASTPDVPGAPTSPGATRPERQRTLSLTIADAASMPKAEPEAAAVARQVKVIYTLAAAVFALVMTMATLISAQLEILPVRLAMVFVVNLWPVFLFLTIDGTASRRTLLLGLCAYLGLLGLLSALALARSPELTAAQLATLWLVMNGPAVLVSFTFIARPVRAIGPLVVVFLAVAILGSVLVLTLVSYGEPMLRAVAGLAASLGLNASFTLGAMSLTGATLFTPVAWRALTWLRGAYRSKRVNDKSIAIDAMFFLFGTIQSIGLAFEGLPWIFSGTIAFLAYQLTLRVVLGRSKRGLADEPAASRLLLLRVFALGKRSRDLFDKVATRWRFRGPVQLIAGPDLATTTVDPEEFIEFVSGSLERLFINDQAALSLRLTDQDCEPDFDHRYRVNDFFCRDNTWKLALAALVRDSDVVLMDLREFTADNAGCVYELTELVNLMPLARLVLVVDNTTDLSLLETTLQKAWSAVRADSPNAALDRAEIQAIQVDNYSDSQLRRLENKLHSAVACC